MGPNKSKKQGGRPRPQPISWPAKLEVEKAQLEKKRRRRVIRMTIGQFEDAINEARNETPF